MALSFNDFARPVLDGDDQSPLYYEVDENEDYSILNMSPHYVHLCKILLFLGHEDWRAGQLPAIHALVNKRDVFVATPPGAGKSTIFQVAGLYQLPEKHGITFVIIPLISLMIDQVSYLASKGIRVLCFHHHQRQELQRDCLAQFQATSTVHPTFVYVTAERFATPEWENLMRRLHDGGHISQIVLDEAHIILDWGRDFRPKYLDFQYTKEKFPGVPILVLSGSVSPEERNALIRFLRIQGCHFISTNPDRLNIHYAVEHVDSSEEKVNKITSYLKRQRSNVSGIIYCRTPKRCKELHQKLSSKSKHRMYKYYGGMTESERNSAYQAWKNGPCSVMIATVAFGMGIDKADVRFVLHYDLPKSLSEYIQETGRAGRDGHQSTCILYYTYSDVQANLKLEGPSAPHEWEKRTGESWPLMRMCYDTACRRSHILAYYGTNRKVDRCINCDTCCKVRRGEKWGTCGIRISLSRKLTKTFQRLKTRRDHVSYMQVINELVKTEDKSKLATMIDINGSEGEPYSATKMWWEKICRRAIQKLILQGVFSVYLVYERHNNVYLKLEDKAFYQYFTIPI